MKVENKKLWNWQVFSSITNGYSQGSTVKITIDPNTGLSDIDKDDWEDIRTCLASAVKYHSSREGFLYIVFDTPTTKRPGFFASLFGMRR